jgi:hypothetical protein
MGIVIASGSGAATTGLWLIGHFVEGIVFGYLVGGTWRGLRALFGGMLLAGAIAGVVLAIGTAIFPAAADPTSGSSPLAMVFGTVLSVAVLGLPVLFFGVIFGTIPVFFRRNRRRRAIARGELAPLVATGPLEQRTDVKGALDDVALAAATADGMATRVVLVYRGSGLDQLMAYDRLRLAALGYALTSEDRRPPRTGIGWTLARIVGMLAGLALVLISRDVVGDPDPFGGIVSERITATYDLQSPTHEPLPVPEIGEEPHLI